jgi:hypothetical protein
MLREDEEEEEAVGESDEVERGKRKMMREGRDY